MLRADNKIFTTLDATVDIQHHAVSATVREDSHEEHSGEEAGV